MAQLIPADQRDIPYLRKGQAEIGKACFGLGPRMVVSNSGFFALLVFLGFYFSLSLLCFWLVVCF